MDISLYRPSEPPADGARGAGGGVGSYGSRAQAARGGARSIILVLRT
eukprot:SAG31_NODE_40736_length_279_cov_0.850000_1_plen_46_part_10